MSSPNQLFLVVEVIQQCRWTAYGKQREGDVDPGCVVVIRPCNGGNEFEVHRGLGVWITPVLISREGGLPRDKVVAITNQEFDILMGTKSDNARVELHSSGRLKWACRLKVGDEVQINSECTVPGVIRGNGTSPSNMPDYGLQFILDITEEASGYYFSDKGKPETNFLCMKNCNIIVPANQLYPPKQPIVLEAKNEETAGHQTQGTAMEVKVERSISMTQLLSMKETLQHFSQQCEELGKTIQKLEDQVTNLRSEKEQLNEQLQHLESDNLEKITLIDQQQEKLSASEKVIEKLCGELEEKQGEIDIIKTESEQRLRDQKQQYEQQLRDQQQQHEQALAEQQQQNEQNLREQQQRYQQEEDYLRQEQNQLQRQVGQLQQDLQEMTDQKQQLQARVETAFAYMRGDPSTSQVGFDAIELWEVPREDVHVSNKILGTGGWGYVAEGTFCGQKVAVKCLHRGILSQFTTNHVRREISIMAQVRHPNLVLLIGAVLNADTGPLIITELLDRTLRSAYEDRLLEEHSKLPIVRDVAAALNYLHSHRRPIIHRDISSSNVLLEAVRTVASWKAKLSDFGSANLIRLATTPAEGAVTYSAPEVRIEARNQQTPKVDVYSFGVLLCEISLCQFPPDPSEFATFLVSVQNNADPRLYDLAQNCTKRDPEERPSMSEVLKHIVELLE